MLYREREALKSEVNNLKKRNEQLLAAYHEQKAKCDEQEARANSIKESNKREAKKCVELGDNARESKDYAKAEKYYKKAAKLDIDLNVNGMMDQIKAAKEAELREREEAEKKKRNEQEGLCCSTLQYPYHFCSPSAGTVRRPSGSGPTAGGSGAVDQRSVAVETQWQWRPSDSGRRTQRCPYQCQRSPGLESGLLFLGSGLISLHLCYSYKIKDRPKRHNVN